MKKLVIVLFLSIPFTILNSNNSSAVAGINDKTQDVQELIEEWEIEVYGGYYVDAILDWPIITFEMEMALNDHSANLRRGYDNNQIQLVKNSLKSLIHDMELIEEKTGWMSSNWAIPKLYDLLSRLE